MKHLIGSILSEHTTMSSLGDEWPLSFGHDSYPCPDSSDVLFDIVDSNSIHSTCVRFCECTPDARSTQLLKASFFPATVAQPQMAFSFTVTYRYFPKSSRFFRPLPRPSRPLPGLPDPFRPLPGLPPASARLPDLPLDFHCFPPASASPDDFRMLPLRASE